MAKVNFNKLGLDTPGGIVEVQVSEDVVIEVKQFLPTFEKLKLVNLVVVESVLNGFVNPFLLDYTFDQAIITSYTNINFTENQLKSDGPYDKLVSSGLFDKIWDAIPDSEKEILTGAITSQTEKTDEVLKYMLSGMSAQTRNFQDMKDYLVKADLNAEELLKQQG